MVFDVSDFGTSVNISSDEKPQQSTISLMFQGQHSLPVPCVKLDTADGAYSDTFHLSMDEGPSDADNTKQPLQLKMTNKRRSSSNDYLTRPVARLKTENNNPERSHPNTKQFFLDNLNVPIDCSAIDGDIEHFKPTIPCRSVLFRRSTTDCNESLSLSQTSTPVNNKHSEFRSLLKPSNTNLSTVTEEKTITSLINSKEGHSNYFNTSINSNLSSMHSSNHSNSLLLQQSIPYEQNNQSSPSSHYSLPDYLSPFTQLNSENQSSYFSSNNQTNSNRSRTSSGYCSSQTNKNLSSFFTSTRDDDEEDLQQSFLPCTSHHSSFELKTSTTTCSVHNNNNQNVFQIPSIPNLKIQSHSLVDKLNDLSIKKQNDTNSICSPLSSLSSSSSSYTTSLVPISTTITTTEKENNLTSDICCRKCLKFSNSTKFLIGASDDEEQQQNEKQPSTYQNQKRPRSLPIPINGTAVGGSSHSNNQHLFEDDDDEEQENETSFSCSSFDNTDQEGILSYLSGTCACRSKKKKFRTDDDDDLRKSNINMEQISTATSANATFNCFLSQQQNKLHIVMPINHKDEAEKHDHCASLKMKRKLEHFIMSPTDKVKVPMKFPIVNKNNSDDNEKDNELKGENQPEEIDFKRSNQRAMRTLYKNRVRLNNDNVLQQRQKDSLIYKQQKSLTTSTTDSSKQVVNARTLRSVLSCSVFEADDEHEVSQTIGNSSRGKSLVETLNCLRGNFVESVLSGKMLPCGTVDGFAVKLGASGLFLPKHVTLPVSVFWFNVSADAACSPYLGFVNLLSLPKRGYHTPTKGTVQLALFNPNQTVVHIFLISYDLTDMPPDHRTFIRQRHLCVPENGDQTKGNLRYLAHLRFVTSQTGKLYLHADIRLIFARNKIDYDDHLGKHKYITTNDLPAPRYWPRK
ncbi:unnamed protein product [Didymodactylos carnosus]|uniref:Atos-like conserved domain-containing protein n=1 Tax=Didymodactylos carnosus TaxID=1234261 RepID=A0A813UES8_9BILA|nr:unnamed protein product [Didymodactylos carnosus]CAF0845269.1 unnamed protein product [Didymodactylos carnosus]CAF3613522.1 unnamed protein product [Didymodactylos carnosus]CAF3630482.1 unnamed protein product [Didymodactylos carnosus]